MIHGVEWLWLCGKYSRWKMVDVVQRSDQPFHTHSMFSASAYLGSLTAMVPHPASLLDSNDQSWNKNRDKARDTYYRKLEYD